MNSCSITVFSPAKLNLFLAITGRRPDGYHELVSLAAQLDFGDRLTAILRTGNGFSLECTDPGVPWDESNLVLKAARAFRAASGWAGGVDFSLEKRIPVGAGLGGGSSNAVATLRALNHLAGQPLGREALEKLAAQLGSDCPLFLHEGPVVMRGRGEILEPVEAAAAARLRGRRVLLFKPGFGISTAGAYAAFARASPGHPPTSRLQAWLQDTSAPAEEVLFNSFEGVAFAQHLALPALLGLLRERFGLAPLMTGSGSACFAFLDEKAPGFAAAITVAVRAAWGPSAFVVEATTG